VKKATAHLRISTLHELGSLEDDVVVRKKVPDPALAIELLLPLALLALVPTSPLQHESPTDSSSVCELGEDLPELPLGRRWTIRVVLLRSILGWLQLGVSHGCSVDEVSKIGDGEEETVGVDLDGFSFLVGEVDREGRLT